MCCTPTLHWLIVLTLPPRLSLFRATGLSALAPAQRAGAQRLRAEARRDILHRDTNSVVNGAYRKLMGSHLLQNMTLVAGNRRHLDIVDNARPRASLCRLRSGSSRCIIPAITAAHKPQGKPQMEMETAAGPTVAVAAPQ